MAFPGVTSASIQFGQETVAYGTEAGSYDYALQLISENLNPAFNKFREQSISAPGKAPGARNAILSESRFVGDFTFHPAYNDFTTGLLMTCLGAVTKTGSGTFTHTGTRAEPSGLDSLSLQLCDNNRSQKCFGVLVEGFRFEFTAGQMATLQVFVIGKSPQARGSSATPTLPASRIIVNHSQAGNLGFDGNNYSIRSAVIEYRRNLDLVQDLGSTEIVKPVATGEPTMNWEITVDEGSNTLHDAYRLLTQGDATLTFTGPSPVSLAFTLFNSYIDTFSDPTPAGGVGRRAQNLTFRGLSDATDQGFQVVVVNEETNTVTNGPT